MADIFISYKTERRAAAEHLAEICRLHGYTVWFDYGLSSGREFGRQIERELRAASAVVVLWCGLSVESDWVNNEAFLAKRLNKFVPVWIEKVDPPLEFLRDHTLDLTVWDGAPYNIVLAPLWDEFARLVGRDPQPQYRALRDLEQKWRRFGAPSLLNFSLSENSRTNILGDEIVLSPLLNDQIQAGNIELIRSARIDYANAKFESAYRSFRRAADSGDPEAITWLGRMCESGEGVPRDHCEAVKYYRKAVKFGCAEAVLRLGNLYCETGGVPEDKAEAVWSYRKAAELGNAAAYHNLGILYANGEGVPEDKVEAERLYRLAINLGHAEAIVSLSRLQAVTGSSEEDASEINGLSYKLSQISEARSAYKLALSYQSGVGVVSDEAEAIRHFRRAADLGYAAAIFGLCNTIFESTSLAEENAEGINLCRTAADLGSEYAALYLGRLYETGDGVAQNDAEAARFYKRALDIRNAEALWHLGLIYDQGEGVPLKPARIKRWFKRAALRANVDIFNVPSRLDHTRAISLSE